MSDPRKTVKLQDHSEYSQSSGGAWFEKDRDDPEKVNWVIYPPSYPQIDYSRPWTRDTAEDRLRLRICWAGWWRVTLLFFLFGFWFTSAAVCLSILWMPAMLGIAWYADYAARQTLKEEADAKYLKACREFEQLRKKIADESKKLPIP
jgi:hypothetical protein